jgi:hypothetical protein
MIREKLTFDIEFLGRLQDQIVLSPHSSLLQMQTSWCDGLGWNHRWGTACFSSDYIFTVVKSPTRMSRLCPGSDREQSHVPPLAYSVRRPRAEIIASDPFTDAICKKRREEALVNAFSLDFSRYSLNRPERREATRFVT